jgi:hypothetical protein
MTDIKLINRTSMTGGQLFLKVICLLYWYIHKNFSNNNYRDIEELERFTDKSLIEIAQHIEIDSSDFLGVTTSAYELYKSLSVRESIFESDLEKYMYEIFNSFGFDDFDYLNESDIKEFYIRKIEQFKSLPSNVYLINVSEGLQRTLVIMQALETLGIDKDLCEHNCIVRNVVELQVAYIQLFIVYSQLGISCNLYWIDGDSVDPEEAIVKETIGISSNKFEAESI